MRAIRAASAFDGERFLPGATVVMEDDRIVRVETRGSEVPAGMEVAEYSGRVLPGLIDCHTHLIADASFGGLERAGSMNGDELDRESSRRDRRSRRRADTVTSWVARSGACWMPICETLSPSESREASTSSR